MFVGTLFLEFDTLDQIILQWSSACIQNVVQFNVLKQHKQLTLNWFFLNKIGKNWHLSIHKLNSLCKPILHLLWKQILKWSLIFVHRSWTLQEKFYANDHSLSF